MTLPLNRTVSIVTAETFEQLAFLFSFPGESVDSAMKAAMVNGCVSFDGIVSGMLSMEITSPVLLELAANMLGIDENVAISAEQQIDAFKEMINVICGNVLPVIAGNGAEFNISDPRIDASDGNTDTGGHSVQAADVRLGLEGGYCDVKLFLADLLPQGTPLLNTEMVG